MPEWEGGGPKVKKLSAEEAFDIIKTAKEEGGSGAIELEGEEAVELMQKLFGAGGVAADALPPELKELLEGNGVNIDQAIVMKVGGGDIPGAGRLSKEEFLKQFLGHTAEEDDRFWDTPRRIKGGGTSSYRKLKANAEETLDHANQGKASPVEGGMALAILSLIKDIVGTSNLLRDAERLIQEQSSALEQAKVIVEKYRDHMVIEHNVAPD